MAVTYSERMAKYAVGRRANAEEWNAITRTNSTAGTLAFGVPVMPGALTHSCIIVDATSGRNVLGITEANVVLPHTGDAYAQDDNVAICESGVIGVLLGADVTLGAQARFNTANATWTGAAQSGTVVTIPGAQFDEAGTSGQVGIVRYRRPVPSLSVSG
jgi:hypothetical protein